MNKKLIRNSRATFEYIYLQDGEKFIKIDFLKKSQNRRTSIKVLICFSAFKIFSIYYPTLFHWKLTLVENRSNHFQQIKLVNLLFMIISPEKLMRSI